MKKIKIVLFFSLLLCPTSLFANLTHLEQLTEPNALNSFNEYFLAFGNPRDQLKIRQFLVDVYNQNLPPEVQLGAMQRFILFLNHRQRTRYEGRDTRIQTMLRLATQERIRLADEQGGYTLVVAPQAETEPEIEIPVVQPRGWFSWLGGFGSSR